MIQDISISLPEKFKLNHGELNSLIAVFYDTPFLIVLILDHCISVIFFQIHSHLNYFN